LYKKPTASIGVFTDRDERLGATVFKRGEPYTTTTPTFGIAQLTSNRTGFAFRKYTNAEDWRNSASVMDRMIIRYAEVLLILAEAKFELEDKTA
jgi:hypothetical protein